MDFRFDIIVEYAPYLLQGTLLTIGLSLAGIAFGTILGLFIGMGKMMRNKVLSLPFKLYITCFRGTPLLVQVLLIHFGVIPLFVGDTNATLAAVVALSLNSAAYIAEIFRSGIQSIEKGQMEAARSLGMTHVQAMKHVILPQATKRIIPPLGNEFIVLIKESSIACIIAAPELMYWGRAMGSQYFKVWEPYLAAAAIYLILTVSLSYVLNRIERRLETT